MNDILSDEEVKKLSEPEVLSDEEVNKLSQPEVLSDAEVAKLSAPASPDVLSDEEVNKLSAPTSTFGKIYQGAASLVAPKADLDARIAQNRAKLNLNDPNVKGAVDAAVNEYTTRTGKKIPTGKLEAVGRAAADVALLGFDDEAYGAIKAANMKLKELINNVPENEHNDMAEYYRVFRDSALQRKEQTQEEHAAISLTTSLVGGVAMAFIPGLGVASTLEKGAQGLGLIRGAKAAATVAEAAIWGAGSATADLTNDEWGKMGHEMAQTLAVTLTGQALFKGVAVGLRKIRGRSAEEVADVAAHGMTSEAQAKAEDVIAKHSEAERATFGATVNKNLDTIDDYMKLPENERAAINAKAFDTGIDQGELKLKPSDVSEDAARSALIQRNANEAGVMPQDYLGYQWAKAQRDDFIKVVGGDLDGYIAKNGEEFTQKVYSFNRLSKETIINGDLADELLRREANTMKRYGISMLDGREVYEGLQSRHQLNIMPEIDKLSKGINLSVVERSSFLNDFKKIYVGLTSAGVDSSKLATWSQMPRAEFEEKVLSTLSEEAKAAVGKYEALTSKWADYYKITKLDASKAAFYVPIMKKDNTVIVADIYRMLNNIKRQTGITMQTMDDAMFKELKSNPVFADLYEGIKFINGRAAGGYDSAKSFRNDLFQCMNPDIIAKKMRPTAGILEQRLDDAAQAPAWMRETDLSKLSARWIKQASTYFNLREGAAYLNSLIPVFESRGDNLARDYVSKHIQDLLGVRADTMAARFNKTKANLQLSLDKMAIDVGEDTFRGQTLKAIGAIPNFTQFAMQQMYPYYLGFRVDAMIRNATTPLVLGAQHIGTDGYGQALHMTAQMNLWKDIAAGNPVFKSLQESGVIAAQHNPEFFEMLHSGLVREVGSVGYAAQKSAQIAMKTFEASEKLARATTHYMAREWAGDVVRAIAKNEVGSALTKSEVKALRAFETNMDPYYRKAALNAIKAKDPARVNDLFSTYLNAKTMFNYDKATASEFAREMGPIFSMFTKWPTTIAGDVVNTLTGDTHTSDKAKRIMWKYMAPLVAFSAMDYVLPNQKTADWMDEQGMPHPPVLHGEETVGTRLTEKLIGKGQFRKWAPIDSVSVVWNNDLTKPAVLQQSAKALAAFSAEGDWRDKTRAVVSAAAPIVPGSSIFRVINDLFEVGLGKDWAEEALNQL